MEFPQKNFYDFFDIKSNARSNEIINAYKNKIMIWNKIYKNKLDKIYNILLRLNSYKRIYKWIQI